MPPRITLRQARAEDVPACASVFLRSIADIARRQGEPPPEFHVRDMVPPIAHLQRTDPKGFHVAVRDGRVVAFASTILRGNTHFLSLFFALPSLQGKGVGGRLLRRAFDGPRPPASAVRCVFASLNTRAQVLYLKFGMFPRGMFYVLSGEPKRSPRPKRGVELVPFGKVGKISRGMLAMAARFDRVARGARRDEDLRYLMSLPGARFFLVRAGRRTLGYAVINEKGRVGPAFVTDARYSAGLAWALNEAARGMGVKKVNIIVPGVNSGALEVYRTAGLKSTFFGAWMSARPVGSFESYLLAGGMLL